jgi:Flp pilus assembly protein TadD
MLVEQGLAKVEQVLECLTLQAVLRKNNVFMDLINRKGSPVPHLGELLLQNGYLTPETFDEAHCIHILEMDPKRTDAWHGRGISRIKKGDLNGAIEDFTRAIELDPNERRAWNDRGIALFEKGDLNGAIADYSRAIELDPESRVAWNNRGNARKDKGDLEGAISDWEQFLKLVLNHSHIPWIRAEIKRIRAEIKKMHAQLEKPKEK